MRIESKFRGLLTALVTPFNNNKIDYQALEILIKRQLDAKVDGIVIAGSTGEGSALSRNEYKELLEFAIGHVNNKIPVIAGANDFSTEKSLELVLIAQNVGADAVMCVTPPYSKPNQRGLIAHYQYIHDNSNIPIILYSVPSRCVIDFSDNTLIELSKLERIVAFKDAGTDITRPLRLKERGIKLDLLSGDDITAVAFNMHGGVGCISVASNIHPEICKKIQDACKDRLYENAEKINKDLVDLYDLLFIESNPAPTKYLLHKLKLCSEELRLPLCALHSDNKKMLEGYITNTKVKH